MLLQAISLDIINCEIGRDEKVFPMIPAGKGYDNMITFDDYNEN